MADKASGGENRNSACPAQHRDCGHSPKSPTLRARAPHLRDAAACQPIVFICLRFPGPISKCYPCRLCRLLPPYLKPGKGKSRLGSSPWRLRVQELHLRQGHENWNRASPKSTRSGEQRSLGGFWRATDRDGGENQAQGP